RGVSKDSLGLTGWPKELTPSTQLRKDFHDGTLGWEKFSDAYRAELDDADNADNGETETAVASIGEALAQGDVVLLFAGKDTEHTHAAVLRDWLEDRLEDQLSATAGG
ncbi:MAG: DUF488 domain-containing protein, partial [Corynebacterium sp.]|uniref:DUF488 domain-containing protein n=1 Tax=Corynebacterium sp. TaxID=1720 RepID=UPI003F91789F